MLCYHHKLCSSYICLLNRSEYTQKVVSQLKLSCPWYVLLLVELSIQVTLQLTCPWYVAVRTWILKSIDYWHSVMN